MEERPTTPNLVNESDPTGFDTPPIKKLHSDLLWSIFALNTIATPSILHKDPESPLRPLTIARRTSQVCRTWREIILGSSSLWGRMIDLDLLGEAQAEWENEVLLRTDIAPLWITGTVRSTRPSEQLFFSLLVWDWERIQKIDVESHGIHHADFRWNYLLQPAPNLEVFNLRRRECDVDLLRNSQVPVFANHAPSLRSFNSFQVPYPVDAPWLSHIRDISFPSGCTVRQALDLCSRTPHLVKFFGPLQRSDQMVDSEHLPYVHLPYLTSIGFMLEELGICLQILGHITPFPGCLLALQSVDNTQETLTPAVLELGSKVIPRWTIAYFSRTVASRLGLEHTSVTICLADESISPIAVFNHSTFSASFMCWDGYDPYTQMMLIRTFIPPPAMLSCYSGVSELNVHFSDVSESAYSAWKSVFDALPGVKTITATHCSIFHLLFLEAKPGARIPNFPALHTLEILIKDEHIDEPIDLTVAVLLLMWYRDSGKPVTLLTLTDRDDRLLNLDIFNVMDGLRLRWRRGVTVVEKICRSG